MIRFAMSLILPLFLLLCVIFNSTLAQISVQGDLQDHVLLADAAAFVIRRFISTRSNTMIIMEKCKFCRVSYQNFHSRLLDHILWHLNDTIAINLVIGEADEQPLNYNVFIVDSVQAFEELRFNFPNTLHSRDFYFLILLTDPTKNPSRRYQMMRKIFVSCLHFNVGNAIIMFDDPNGSEQVFFFGFKLFGVNCDEELIVRLMNTYYKGTMEKDYLFPLRFRDFFNCTFRVCGHILPPLLEWNGDPHNRSQWAETSRLSGIDGNLLLALSEILNFSIGLTVHHGPSQIGIYGNSTGCFAMLANRSADIVVGGMTSTHPNRFIFTPTVCYHQSPYHFIVRSELDYDSLGKFLHPFEVRVWCSILTTLVVAIILIRFLFLAANRYLRDFVIGRKNHNPIVNLLTIFLGNPIPTLPKGTFARFLIMSWMLATLVLRNAYQGKLFDSLRVSCRRPLPKRIDELKDHDFTLIASQYIDDFPYNRTKIVNGDFQKRYEIVNQARFQRLTTVSMLDNLAHYNYNKWNTSYLTYVSEPIYTFQLAMYLSKHSIFKFTFDMKLKQLMSAGINSFLENRFIKKKYLNMNFNKFVVSQIDNWTLVGLYMAYITFILLAMLIFVLELLSKRIKILKAFFMWINCLNED